MLFLWPVTFGASAQLSTDVLRPINRHLIKGYATRFKQTKTPVLKAQQKYEKYLGRMVSRLVRQTLPEFEQPAYVKSSMYMRAGTPIVLKPNAAYFERFRSDPEKVFVHHSLEAYYAIAEQL